MMNNPDTQSTTKLSTLLARYILVLVVILGLAFSYVINTVYEWGNDDSVHYFMQLAAESYYNDNKANTTPLKVNDFGSITVYDSLDKIPANTIRHFKQSSLNPNELNVHEKLDKIIYLLPYKNTTNNNLIYVVSEYIFSDEDTNIENYISNFTTLTISLTLIISVMLITVLWRSILTPIKKLSDWSETTKDNNQNDIEGLLAQRPSVKVLELEELGQRIASNLSSLSQKNNQEKQFLKSLSHELRTPLAVTKASLELLNKTEKNLTPNTQKKLTKIQKANDNMCATSDALLWLWSGDFKKFQPKEIKLDNLIHNAIDTNRYLITNKNIEIITELAQDTIIANPTLLEILIRNLVRNAFQYTPLGKIEIRWHQGKLTIENTIGDTHQNEIAEQSDYGFGVGTHLSNAICESQSWDISISKTAAVFKVAVSFRA